MEGQSIEAANPVEPTSGVDPVARETGYMEVLDEGQCWELLSTVEVGRLAVAVAGEVDIYPVNFVVDGHELIFRTAEGTKLVEVVMAGRVAFETDGYDPDHGRAWSVVIKGQAQNIDRFAEIYHAQDLPLFPWNASPKERFVKITPTVVTGRRFTVYRTRSGGTPQL
jgi:nitroimidazol reductase NimA-like FMN-containing flavoprotein (pyridoxamine 5'-phosphate oxidase superfamily)